MSYLISGFYTMQPRKPNCNIARYNRIVIKRRLRAASFVPAPRLIKGFHNNPKILTGRFPK